jgi:RNA polymerase sigma factor (sigma-70 family)
MQVGNNGVVILADRHRAPSCGMYMHGGVRHPGEGPEAWVRRVALNLAAERARRLRRQTRALLRLGPPPQVPAASAEALALLEALRTLPMRQRQAIVLHHLVDLPVQEVARMLGVRPGTVKSLLARGRRALANRLSDAEEVLKPP